MFDALKGLPEPTPEAVATARKAADLSQAEAASLVGLADRGRWSEYERGIRSPDAARWAIFLLAVGQHPTLMLIDAP